MKCKFAVLILLFVMCIPSAEAGCIVLRLWDFPRWLEPGEKTDRFLWVTKQLAKFEKENPGIKVELTKLTWQRGNEKILIAALGGQQPDIAPGTVPLKFIEHGLIEPVDEYMSNSDKSDYLSSALEAFRVGSHIYGWPWYMSGQLLYVNLDIAKAAGADKLLLSKSLSLKDFANGLDLIKAYQKSQKAHYPLGLYFQKSETANLPFLLSFGAKIINSEGECDLDSRQFKEGLLWVKELVNKGIVPRDTGGKRSDDIWQAFAVERRLAAAAFGLWAIRPLETRFPMNFAVIPFPGKTKTFTGTSGYYVFKHSDKNRVKAAMKLAAFLTSGENQRALKAYSQFPTRKSSGNLYIGDKHMTEAWNVLQNGTSVYADSCWPQVDEEFEASVQKCLLAENNFNSFIDKELKASSERIDYILNAEKGTLSGETEAGRAFSYLVGSVSLLALGLALYSKQIHLLMTVPALGVLVLFLFYPLADAVILAFQDYRPGSLGELTLFNFIRAFKDPKFIKACYNTFIYALITVPANTLSALIAASLIFGLKGKLKSFFRGAYYLPGVASVVVLTMVWRWMFNSEVGLFNEILTFLGFNPVGWLTDPDVALGAVILSNIIKSPGGAILIYLASMANIPSSLYEAAELDGASPLARWRYITVPMLSGTTGFLLTTGTISALQVFAQVMMLTDGGPGISTQVVVHRVYTAAFRDFDFGLASAMSLMLFLIIMAVTAIQTKFRSRGGDYAEC